MKHLLLLIAAMTALLITTTVYAGEQNCTLSFENMSCASCPFIIKQTLAQIPGVKEVDVSFEKKTATVVYDDAQTDVAALTEATTNVGFPSKLAE